MTLESGFIFFVYYLMAPIVFTIGTLGNTASIAILSRRRMDKIGPKSTYLYLFISDFSFLFLILVNYFAYGFEYDLTVTSKYVCKIYWYVNYFMAPVSPWLIIYISFEKVISIRYPSKRYLFRNKNNQLIYLLIIIAYNSLYYLPVAYYFTIASSNETNSTPTCDYVSPYTRQLINYMDTANRIIVPFLVITGCSISLLVSIVRIKIRISRNFGQNNHQNLSRDIQLVFSLLFLNTVFILLNVPVVVSIYYSFSDFGFVLTLYIFYSTYAVNFYIIFLTNSVFRKEFLLFLNFKKRYRF